MWNHSRIQPHAGKLQMWNRAAPVGTHCLLQRKLLTQQLKSGLAITRLPLRNGIRVLGTPLGERAHVEAQLQRTVQEHRHLLARIPNVSDLQSAWLLLLFCASTCADFFLRIVHPSSSAQFARQHDIDMWGCFCRLLDILPDRSFWEVASLPLSMGGLGLRSTSRTAVSAHWASWADCLGMIQERHATIADLFIRSLDAPPESAFHLSGAVECRTLLTGVGFETPSWFVVASAPPRRPTVAETDPAVRAHGWQFFASRAVEEQFVASTVTPRLTPTEQAEMTCSDSLLTSSACCSCAACSSPSPCPLAPAGVAVHSTSLATTVQHARGQGFWVPVGFRWRLQLPGCAGKLGCLSMSSLETWTSQCRAQTLGGSR